MSGQIRDNSFLSQTPEFVSRNLIASGDSLDRARVALSRVFVDHRIHNASQQPARPIQLAYRRFEALALCYFDYGRKLDITPDLLRDFYLVQIPILGGSEVRCGSTLERSVPGRVSVLPLRRDFSIQWAAEARQVVIQIDRRHLTKKLETYMGFRLTRSPEFDLAPYNIVRPSSPIKAALEGLMGLALSDQFKPADRALIASGFEDTLIHALLFSVESDMSQAIRDRAISTACPRAVRRAEEYIEAHLTEPITIEDLALVSGVSSRSLFESFRRFRDMTPMRFVKFLRLQRVHKRLTEGNEGTRVSSVALDCGFNHLGRFAKDYADAFGESPSATLQKSRQQLHPVSWH